ncbi:MAG: glycosyltransferase [Pseudomonadota bacterium]|nr:glycosyltransferase [Pseudomonadota bacterium]
MKADDLKGAVGRRHATGSLSAARARWLLLSDGALPTEDIYFMATAAPGLRKAGANVTRLNTRRWVTPRLCWPWLGRLLSGAQVIVCRSLPRPWLELLESQRGLLASLHYLLDDDIGAAAEDASLPPPYRERMALLSRYCVPRLLALADEVVVASERLARRLSSHHGTVTVLTPALGSLPGAATPLPGDGQWRLGYHGTRAHREDLAKISPALVNVLSSFDSASLEVAMGAFTPEPLRDHKQVMILAPMGWHAYRRRLGQTRLHVGLAPLWPSAFNSAKSHLKFLEIARMGGVGVYSRRSPYQEIVDDGVDGVLVDDDGLAWQEALERLLSSPEHIQIMARRAVEKAADIGNPARHEAFWRERQC